MPTKLAGLKAQNINHYGLLVFSGMLLLLLGFRIGPKLLTNQRTLTFSKLEVDEEGQFDHDQVRKVMKLAGGTDSCRWEKRKVKMQHCPCEREISVSSDRNSDAVDYSDTTCSQDAFARGSGQKVIAFSYFGSPNKTSAKKKHYLQGLEGNLDLMEEFYPGWIMRLYIDSINQTFKEAVCELACSNPLLDICLVEDLPGTPMNNASAIFPMIWRFFPTLDPQVDIYLSRDLDSRFSWREASAVADWLQSSNQPIHIMRDSIYHLTPFIGCCWGSHLGRKSARSLWQNSWREMLKSELAWRRNKAGGPDQTILTEFVWPWAQSLSVQHDSYNCKIFNGSIPFPTKRLKEANNHVSANVALNASYWKECPEECRPREHQDWTTC